MTISVTHDPQRNAPVVVKAYRCPAERAAAARHLRFLAQASNATGTGSRTCGARLPALLGEGGSVLVMEQLTGRVPAWTDLHVVSAALGQLHAAVHRAGLHSADLDQPFPAGGWTLPAFPHRRAHALALLPADTHGRPPAVYKDCNIRNVLVGNRPAVGEGRSVAPVSPVGFVDFDDLTLAPFGYDLAKLLVSAAMTYGRPAPGLFEDCLDAYNAAVVAASTGSSHESRPAPTCSHTDLMIFTEIHHILTAKYTGRHGYRHAWPDVRPWAAPG
jgi:hypothetical protein